MFIKDRLLIIEPNQEISKRLQSHFSTLGFQIDIFINADFDLTTLEGKKPDGVLLASTNVGLLRGEGTDENNLWRQCIELLIPCFVLLNERPSYHQQIGFFPYSQFEFVKPLNIERLTSDLVKEAYHYKIWRFANSAESVKNMTGVTRVTITIHNLDKYGTTYGQNSKDMVIWSLGEIIWNMRKTYGTYNDALKILDENQFIVWTYSKQITQFVQYFMEQFEPLIQTFHSFIDRERGYFQHGDEQISIMQVSIAIT